MANIQKLEAVLDFIRAHPEQHDQAMWGRRTSCGTTMCFAGTATHLAGHQLLWDTENLGLGDDTATCAVPLDHPLSGQYGKYAGTALISAVAAYELELDSETGYDLFHTRHTLESLEELVKDIANNTLALV